MSTYTEITSASGGAFEALIETEHDGSLSILTPYRPGYGSAHLAYAYTHFGSTVSKEIETKYQRSNGAIRVLTCWRLAA